MMDLSFTLFVCGVIVLAVGLLLLEVDKMSDAEEAA